MRTPLTVTLCVVFIALVAGCGATSPKWPKLAMLPKGELKPTALPGALGLGQPRPVHTWSAMVADVDGDGSSDVLLVRHLIESGRLYRRRGDRFDPVRRGTFVKKDRHFCASSDVNGDKKPDVFCTVGADRGRGVKANELWIGAGRLRFVDRAEEYGLRDRYGRGRFATFIDVNHDRWPDLLVGNAAPREDQHVSSTRLYLNDRGRRFHDASELGLDRPRGDFCLQAADVDGDGWEDVLACENDGLHLFRNLRGNRFADVSRKWRVARRIQGITEHAVPRTRHKIVNDPRPPWRAARLVDINDDGHLDLVGLGATGIMVQQGTGSRFADPRVLGTLPLPTALAFGDADGDGRSDIYVVQTCNVEDGRVVDRPDVLLQNQGGMRFAQTQVRPTNGCGQSAAAIRVDGRDAFIVMNGRDRFVGPVQVIRFR